MRPTSGQGCVHGRIGYVEQKPWIMDDTFRENVLMGADFDEAYFWQVVEACALAVDVRLFPSGDLTMIGTNGVNLSGGQKVRLTLARALYLRANIYVLDNLLAAVDTHVERHIVERVLATDGIIGQKTRILVTHAEHLVPLSDTVIALNLRISPMTDSYPATMVQSLKHYLVVNAPVTIGRHQINLFETWIRETVWTATLMAKMRKQVLDLTLSMPLPLLESLPCLTMNNLYNKSVNWVARSFTRVICHSITSTNLSAVSTISQVAKLLPELLLLCVPLVALCYVLKLWFGDTENRICVLQCETGNRSHERLNDVLERNRLLLRVHGKTCFYLDKFNRFNSMCLSFVSSADIVRGSFNLMTTLCTEAIKTSVLALKLGLGENNIGQLSRFISYTEDTPREQPRIIDGSRPLPTWPAAGKIEFRRYSIRYRSDLDSTLNELSFVIRSKEKLGIVGLEADSGSIIIDGIDISTIGLHDLRSRVGIIPQDPSLFEGTIRDNLDPAHQYTDDEVWAAINACQIADLLDTRTEKYTEKPVTADDDDDDDDDESNGRWIEGAGLDKWIEYSGSNFSVGQQQLISLCRALLWRRKILVLDEATANIDTETNRIMQSVIQQEFKDCTILTTAHRINTIMDSNRVLVMDQGKVAEFDSPANLLSKDGPF
ncbi:ABC transporter C member 13 [Coemansia sp. S146]|nr:ABC transporter C member 13 [Coemansia sp. S146]